MNKPPKLMLAADPGLSTGLAWFVDGELSAGSMKICRSLDDLTDYLEELEDIPGVLVMEKYQLFKWLALQQSGSKMEVAQAEGILKSWARRNKIKLVEQSPSVLAVAVKFSKMPLPSNHRNSHHISAANHGFYYLVSNGMRLPVGAE